MNVRYDLVIVGGGIVGAACAARLARDGLRVLVLESGLIGGGATAAGMGHIVVMDDSPAQLALTSYSRRLWRQLAQRLPARAEWDPCGTIWVAADEAEMELVEQKQAALARYDVDSVVLGPDELYGWEPQLRAGLAGGLRVPDDVVLYPPVAAAWLLEEARGSGAELRVGCRVVSIDQQGGVGMQDGTSIAADIVLLATGSWAKQLLPELLLRPRKGHLAITDRYPGFVRHQLIELGYLKSAHALERESVAFNIQPRKTGQMLIGSSRQFDADTTDVEMRVVGRMLRRAIHFLPALEQLSTIRLWTGYRAATDDKLPLIGPSGTDSRVWLATGHEGLGITTALGTAELVADQLAGRPPAIDAQSYLPERFSMENLARD